MTTIENQLPELIKLPATRIVGLLKNKQVSPGELLDVLEQRIAQVEGTVNALPTLCLDRAHHAIERWEAHQLIQTPLGGLPVTIKDLNDVKGVRCTRGSLLYENHVSPQSDILVEQLESNGAIIYAKSNTPEFGTGGNTYNKVLGTTRNPWNQRCSVAGSSGGAAASLATGTAWLAQGSDMGGSLRNPASFCGVVGLRPTVGRVAATCSGTVSDTLSTNGPMARNVQDLAFFLDVMSGHHPLDPLSLPAPPYSFEAAAKSKRRPSKVAFSLTLGGVTPVDPEVAEVLEKAAQAVESTGVIVEQAEPDFSGVHEIFDILRAYSYAAGLGDLLADHRSMLNQDVVWNIEQGLALSVNEIARAQAMRVDLVGRVARFFDQYDLIMTPATVVPPYSLDQRYVAYCNGHRFDNYYRWLSIAYAFTTALCPALSMPCGLTRDHLPVGMQLAARAGDEANLLSAANGFEEIFGLGDLTPITPVVKEHVTAG